MAMTPQEELLIRGHEDFIKMLYHLYRREHDSARSYAVKIMNDVFLKKGRTGPQEVQDGWMNAIMGIGQAEIRKGRYPKKQIPRGPAEHIYDTVAQTPTPSPPPPPPPPQASSFRSTTPQGVHPRLASTFKPRTQTNLKPVPPVPPPPPTRYSSATPRAPQAPTQDPDGSYPFENRPLPPIPPHQPFNQKQQPRLNSAYQWPEPPVQNTAASGPTTKFSLQPPAPPIQGTAFDINPASIEAAMAPYDTYPATLYKAAQLAGQIIVNGGGIATRRQFKAMVVYLVTMHNRDTKRKSPREIMGHVFRVFKTNSQIAAAFQGQVRESYIKFERAVIKVAQQYLDFKPPPPFPTQKPPLEQFTTKDLRKERNRREKEQQQLLSMGSQDSFWNESTQSGSTTTSTPVPAPKAIKKKKNMEMFKELLGKGLKAVGRGAEKGFKKVVEKVRQGADALLESKTVKGWEERDAIEAKMEQERKMRKWIGKIQSALSYEDPDKELGRYERDKLKKFAAEVESNSIGASNLRKQFFETVERLKKKLGWKW